MNLVQPSRVVVPVAQASLDAFDPDPLASYVTSAGDTLARIVERFYGRAGAEHPDLVALLAQTNGLRPGALLPAGVLVVVPQANWRVLV